MDKLIIKGGRELVGDVFVSGSKNAALPIMAAALLAEGRYRITNVPILKDVFSMGELLGRLGVENSFEEGALILDNQDGAAVDAP
ncbi:MAG: UDP-N-acetylglucosamine 1-carboxyvinyltransferase, partial [Deferribacteraceae bacterium]|nr:UDP-N-acetylglucosamine 1-carboxyvinyltransferase [Deferribacteraceae bacterium]